MAPLQNLQARRTVQKMHVPTQYFLSPNCYCCEVEDGAIILDLTTGSYLGIDAAHLPDLRSTVGNWPSTAGMTCMETSAPAVASGLLIENLVSKRILTQTITPEQPVRLANPAFAAENIAPRRPLRQMPVRHVTTFLVALITVAVRSNDRTLRTVLRKLCNDQSLLRCHSQFAQQGKSLGFLDSFLRLRLWFYTADGHCLFDSLVLAVFLTRKMILCTFVIGVSTKPFLAHSWVQIGDLVLNDTPEHVQTFTPILTIGEAN